MKTTSILVSIVSFIGMAAMAAIGRTQTAQTATNYQTFATPLATSTPYRVPTATVNYQATAQIAQATADEARRVNAAATIAYLNAVNDQARFTEQAEQRSFAKVQMTATAAGTVIPLTATAQVVNSTAIAQYENMQAAMLTATSEAPAKLIAYKQAEIYEKYGVVEFYMRMMLFSTMIILFLALSVFVLLPRKAVAPVAPVKPAVTVPEVKIPEMPPVQSEVVLNVKSGTEAFPKLDRHVLPCTLKQFDALVHGVIDHHISLAVNNWEGGDSPFTREQFYAVRNFLQSNQLVQSNGNRGDLILTAEGESIFNAWLENGVLPTEYYFGQNMAAV